MQPKNKKNILAQLKPLKFWGLNIAGLGIEGRLRRGEQCGNGHRRVNFASANIAGLDTDGLSSTTIAFTYAILV